MKKAILTLGTISAIITPVIAVVSCGTKEKVRSFNILPTYTGQADQLIALGVHSDYYPMQLNVHSPYAYLTNPGQYMVQQSDDFKTKFSQAINGLMPSVKGPSWWNQDAKNSDDNRIDNTYWQKQEGKIVMYEHYLLDDDQKVIESSWAPGHHSETAIQTNFRASRDPFTRIPKAVFYGWDISKSTIEKMANGETLTTSDLTSISSDGINDLSSPKSLGNEAKINSDKKSIDVSLNGENITVKKDDALLIKSLRDKRRDFVDNKKTTSDWFYNDWFFVDFFHKNYLDNKQFQNSHFKDWLIDSNNSNPFSDDTVKAAAIKSLFDASTFRVNEVKNGMKPSSTAHSHHPIYEQQEGEIGAAPMFEGAMRDNQLYLFNVSSQVSNLVNYGTPYGKQHFDSLSDGSAKDSNKDVSFHSIAKTKYEANQIKKWIENNVSASQLKEMKAAYDNANTITGELKNRMQNMKEYFKSIGVNGKRFGIMTVAPGHGVSTIQSMSKFSFVYKELGFTQPVPSNLQSLKIGSDKYNNNWKNQENSYIKDGALSSSAPNDIKKAIGKDALFNMDDNGWFWNIGTTQKNEGGGLSSDKLGKFKGTFDMGIIASRDDNYDAEIKNNSGIKTKVAELFNSNLTDNNQIIKKAREHANYDLWNEGLKTPFVLHMLLDQIMTKAQEYAMDHGKTKKDINNTKFVNAKSWGNYFNTTFIK